MKIKKIMMLIFFLVTCWLIFKYLRDSTTVTYEELAQIIDVDLSYTDNISLSKSPGELVKNNGAYDILKIRIPSFYKIKNNKDETQLLIPCYLFLYKDGKKRPGVLIVPGNGPGMVSTAGFVDDYEDSNALRLAEAGFNVLTCDNIGFANYTISLYTEEQLVKINNTFRDVEHYKTSLPPQMLSLLFNKKTIIGTIVQDQLQALRVLKSIPAVSKIGVGGTSMGGMIAIYLGVFDKEVSSVLSAGFFNKFSSLPPDYHWDWYDFTEELPGGKMLSITSLIAPKPAAYVNGKKDKSQPLDTSIKLFKELKKAYRYLSAEENVSLIIHDGGHIWKNDVAIDFFSKTLKT